MNIAGNSPQHQLMSSEDLSISQASRLLGVSRPTLYSAIADGRLPQRHVLDRLVVTEAEIKAAGLGKTKRGRAEGKPITEAHKKAISEAQRRSWAERKKK